MPSTTNWSPLRFFRWLWPWCSASALIWAAFTCLRLSFSWFLPTACPSIAFWAPFLSLQWALVKLSLWALSSYAFLFVFNSMTRCTRASVMWPGMSWVANSESFLVFCCGNPSIRTIFRYLELCRFPWERLCRWVSGLLVYNTTLDFRILLDC